VGEVAVAASVTVTVSNPAPGGGNASSTFTVNNPVPAISSFAPATGSAGTGAFTLTINGSGFVAATTAQFNGSARTVTFISGSQIGVALTAADNALGGTFPVIVQNAAPGGGLATSNYTINYLAPTITSFNPVNPVALGPAFTLTVNGTNFYSTSTVSWVGSPRTTTFISATQLGAALTAADIAAAGNFNVTVNNPAPGGGTSPAVAITVNNPVPSVTSLAPSSVIVQTGAFTLTVNGTNFVPGCEVRWNGSGRTTTFVSNTQVTAAITAGDIATAGTVNVTVFNPTPGGGLSGSQTFTMNNPLPAITSLSPTTLPVILPSDFILLVTGSNFVQTSVIRWGGADRSTQFISGTQVAATIPRSDLTKARDVKITVFSPAPGGGESSALTFTVTNPEPIVGLLSPSSATAGGGDFTLTISGGNFFTGSIVRWNGSDRISNSVSSRTLTATIKAADIASGGVFPVTVFNPGPGGGASGLSFSVNNGVPVLTSLSPSTAKASAGALTLTGTAFSKDAVALWNGAARATTFVSSTSLKAAISAADLAGGGSALVAVANPSPGGGLSNALTFTITGGAPVLTALSPALVNAGNPDMTLTVTGTNFVSGSTVNWNGAARSTTFLSSTSLAAAIPAADIAIVGTAAITVSNPLPDPGTSAALIFTISTPQPVIEIETSKTSYVPGDTVTASVFRLKNPRSTAATAEFKVWLRLPGAAPISILNMGADSSVTLPANFTQDVGPVAVMAVTASNTNGSGELSSRVIDPVTGELLSEDINPFTVSGATPAEPAEEPVEAVVGNPNDPSLEIVLNAASYTTGETVTATTMRLRNPGTAAVPVEVKAWRGSPDKPPASSLNLGPDGSFSLPAGFDTNVGPVTLFTVSSSTTLGNYEFSGRMLDPVTGKQYSQSLNPFVVR
jgi:hypothetical protein